MSTAISMRNVQLRRKYRSIDLDQVDAGSGIIRILILDHDTEIAEQIENALWIWPHKVSLAANIEEAERLCRHLQPSAILAGVDRSDYNENKMIPALRRRLPNVPIIALGSRKQFVAPGKFLDQGADALLLREEAHRPTLHGLLMSVQHKSDTSIVAPRPHVPDLSLPWRHSEMMGALICDVTGLIVDSNQCLATWLGYPDTAELTGNNARYDLLANGDDWASWKQVAGDTGAIVHQSCGITARNGQILWMRIEVFASPRNPNHLQVVFVDQTELAILAGEIQCQLSGATNLPTESDEP